MRLFELSVVAPFGDIFLGIIFGIIEVFGPDGSFAAPAGSRIVTNGLIWLFRCKRLPIPVLDSFALTCIAIMTSYANHN